MSYGFANFDFAEKFIKAGAVFESKYVVYTMRKYNDAMLRQHLEDIKPYVNSKEFSNANKIISAMKTNLQVFSKGNPKELQTWYKITYTNDAKYLNDFTKLYKDFVNAKNPLINCMFDFVNKTNYLRTDVKIIAPVIDEEPFSAFHNFKLGLIYTPFNDFSKLDISIFLHEVAHYIVHKKFNNYGFPFQKGNLKQEQDYDSAAVKTLCNIGKLIKFECSYNTVDNLTSFKVINDLFQNSVIALFNYNAMLKNEKYSVKLKDKTLDHIIQKFDISSTLVNDFGREKAISLTVAKMINDLDLNSEQVIILERIGDYVSRGNGGDYRTELIVRLIEFVGRELSTEALSYIEPLSPFWLKNICDIEDKISYIGELPADNEL